MVKNANPTVSNHYPLLTWEMLERLDRKAHFWKITPSDCELIDHYLTSIGEQGWLMEFLEAYGIFTFDDIDEALTRTRAFDLRPIEVAGFIRHCIGVLMDRINAGEKIY